MTSTQAKQIAINYLLQQSDYVFSDVEVKRHAPANGEVKVWCKTEDQYGDELIIEVEIVPSTNEISWKKICNTGKASEYLHPATSIEELTVGQRFRLRYDCVVYEYCGETEEYGHTAYAIRRSDRYGDVSRIGLQEVFPIE